MKEEEQEEVAEEEAYDPLEEASRAEAGAKEELLGEPPQPWVKEEPGDEVKEEQEPMPPPWRHPRSLCGDEDYAGQ